MSCTATPGIFAGRTAPGLPLHQEAYSQRIRPSCRQTRGAQCRPKEKFGSCEQISHGRLNGPSRRVRAARRFTEAAEPIASFCPIPYRKILVFPLFPTNVFPDYLSILYACIK